MSECQYCGVDKLKALMPETWKKLWPAVTETSCPVAATVSTRYIEFKTLKKQKTKCHLVWYTYISQWHFHEWFKCLNVLRLLSYTPRSAVPVFLRAGVCLAEVSWLVGRGIVRGTVTIWERLSAVESNESRQPCAKLLSGWGNKLTADKAIGETSPTHQSTDPSSSWRFVLIWGSFRCPSSDWPVMSTALLMGRFHWAQQFICMKSHQSMSSYMCASASWNWESYGKFCKGVTQAKIKMVVPNLHDSLFCET